MLSHARAVCAAIVAAATLVIAANAGPARGAAGEPAPERLHAVLEHAEGHEH